MAFLSQATILYVLYALLWGYFLLAKSKVVIHMGVGVVLMVMGFMIGLPALVSITSVIVIVMVSYKYQKAQKATA